MNGAAVLIIDDEENLRKLLARIIELEGYAVYQAATAKSAMKVLEREIIHAVILDVKLPDANGRCTRKSKTINFHEFI